MLSKHAVLALPCDQTIQCWPYHAIKPCCAGPIMLSNTGGVGYTLKTALIYTPVCCRYTLKTALPLKDAAGQPFTHY